MSTENLNNTPSNTSESNGSEVVINFSDNNSGYEECESAILLAAEDGDDTTIISDSNELESETTFNATVSDELESENTLKLNGSNELDSELVLTINSNKQLDSQITLLLDSNSELGSEIKLKINRENELESEMYLYKELVIYDEIGLNSEINLAFSGNSELYSEMVLSSTRYNIMEAEGVIVQRVNPKIKVYGDNDTFVRENEPFLNYYSNSSIKSGTINNEGYKGYIKFDELLNLSDVVVNNILSANIVFKPINSNQTDSFRIIDISDYSEKEITWYHQPNIIEKIIDVNYEESLELYKADITSYVKKICNNVGIHEGFLLDTDSIVNVYSSNSGYKPYIEIEYFDPSLATANKYLNSEIKINLLNTLQSELQLEFINPTLQSELIMTRNKLSSELIQIWEGKNELQSELIYEVKDRLSILDSELKIISDDSAILYSEMDLSKSDSVNLDSEMNIIKVNNSLELDSQVNYVKEDNISELESELILMCNKELQSELAFIKKTESTLPSEVVIKFNTEDTLESEIDINFGKELESEMNVKFENITAELPSNINVIFEEKLNSEMKFNLYKELPSEMIVKFVNNKVELPSEMIAEIISSKALDSEIKINLYKELDSQVNYLKANNTAELNSQLYLDLGLEKFEEYLQSEININILGISELKSEMVLSSTRYNLMSANAEIIKRENPKVRVYADNDTFVYSGEPYLNYYSNSSIKSGYNTDGEQFAGFIKFTDLINQPAVVNKNIISAKIVFRNVDSKAPYFKLQECSNIKEREVTWFKQPYIYSDILAVPVLENKYYTADITPYVREICNRKYVHDGFALISDEYLLSVYSSNSGYKPYIEIEYWDPNALFATGYLDSEIKFNLYDVLQSELQLEFTSPTLQSELIMTRNKLSSELIQIWEGKDTLQSELKLPLSSVQEMLSSELIFSKNTLHSEIKLGKTAILDSELCAIVSFENTLQSEMTINGANYLPSCIDVVFEKSLDSELLYVTPVILDSELLFSRNFVNSEINLQFEDRTELQSELILSSKGVKHLYSEMTYLKEENNSTLPSELKFKYKGIDELNSELKFALYNELLGEITLKYEGAETELQSKLEFNFAKELNSEMRFNLYKELDSEMIVSFNEEKILESEMIARLISAKALSSEVKFSLTKELNSQLNFFKENATCELNSELYLDDPNTITEKIELSSEINFAYLGYEILQSEMVLSSTRYNLMSANAEIIKRENPKIRIYPDNDTFVRKNQPYINYFDASTLKSGSYNDEVYKSFISFAELNEINELIEPKYIISATMVFNKETMNVANNMEIYEAQDFKEKEVNWFIQPETFEKLFDVQLEGNQFKLDVTKYVRDIAYGLCSHSAFYLDGDGYLNLYSSNSGYKPYIEIEYWDPNALFATSYLKSEMTIRGVAILNSEMTLVNPFPELQSELIMTRNKLSSELVQVWEGKDTLQSELKLHTDPIALELPSELVFSRNFVNSELVQNWKDSLVLDSEMILHKLEIENVELPSEIIFSRNFVKSELIQNWKNDSSLNSELMISKNEKEILNSELLFSRDFIQSELELTFPDVSNELHSELIFDLSNGTELKSELKLFLPEVVKELPSELSLVFKEELASELMLSHRVDLPSEITLKITDVKAELDSEMEVIFRYGISLDSELSFSLYNELNSELMLRKKVFSHVRIIRKI